MVNLTLCKIAEITQGTLCAPNGEERVTDIITDSREVGVGKLFVALRGDKFDGHDFIQDAAYGGCAAVMAENREKIPADVPYVLVENCLHAMACVARFLMEQKHIPTVGIVGSVGKTTTRDMTCAVLSEKYITAKNKKNFNNEIGVPLTVFAMDADTQAAVIEMGMDNFGEIDRLAAISQPDIAVFTNIGMSHIERLGSQENIYKAKSEILAHIKVGGTVVLNADDGILTEHTKEIKQNIITYGVRHTADVTAANIAVKEKSVSFTLCYSGQTAEVTLPVPGAHNVANALAAAAAGICLGVSLENIAHALANFTLEKRRSDIICCGEITVIDDTYNASPSSVTAALEMLSVYTERKVAVLGDIKALGAYSYGAHKSLGDAVVANNVDILITVGQEAHYIAEGAFENGMDSMHIFSADTVQEAYSILSDCIKPRDVVLVKASRAMELERITAFLKENF